MTEFLETRVDKFTFRVASDRLYSPEGLWVKAEQGNRVRIGLSDFLQQRSGDVAFAEVKPAGSLLAAGEEMAVIETIKVSLSLYAPLGGRIVEINPALAASAEVINQDPYGLGWLALVEAQDRAADEIRLLDAQAYFEHMKRTAELENKEE